MLYKMNLLRTCLGDLRTDFQWFTVLAKSLQMRFTSCLLRGGEPSECAKSTPGSQNGGNQEAPSRIY